MKRWQLIVQTLCLSLFLVGYSFLSSKEALAAAITEPVPVQAEHTMELKDTMLTFPWGGTCDRYDQSLNLRELIHEQVGETLEILSGMPMLRYIDLGEQNEAQRGLTWNDVSSIIQASNGAEVSYHFSFMGYNFSTLDEVLDLNHLEMTDNGLAVQEILPCMQHLKTLDMDFCGVDDEHMAAIRAEYPNIDVIWRIWFGVNCSVRTDAEIILANTWEHGLTDENSTALQYCSKVKYMDIAHQKIKNLHFLSNMPDLEVCILSSNLIEDISPIAECTNLEYLEILCNKITDLAPLGSLVNLEHLNLVSMHGDELKGWEALANLKKLKRLWLAQDSSKNSIPGETLSLLKSELSDTIINTDDSCVNFFWRYDVVDSKKTERFAQLSEQFDYDHYKHSCSRIGNDPKYYSTR